MNFTKLFEDFIFTEPNQVKLNVTSDLSFLDQDRQDDISAMYVHAEPKLRWTASFLNALYTQRKTTFIFSRKIMEELLTGDYRSKRSTMNGDDQKDFMAYLLKNKIVQILREASKHAGPAAKSAVIEVIHPEIVHEIEKLVGKEYLAEQRAATIRFYDEFEKMKSGTSTKTSTGTDVDIASALHPPSAVPSEGGLVEPIQKQELTKEEKDKIRRSVDIDLLAKNDPSSLLVKLEQILALLTMSDKTRNMFTSFKAQLIEGQTLTPGHSGQLATVNSRYCKVLKVVGYSKKLISETTRNLEARY